jgi:hypothetical protein
VGAGGFLMTKQNFRNPLFYLKVELKLEVKFLDLGLSLVIFRLCPQPS